MNIRNIPDRIHICVADTIQRHGYNPYDMPDGCTLPAVIACIVCQRQFELQISGIPRSSGKCQACRGQDSWVKSRKKGGWHNQPAPAREPQKSEHRRCWSCGKHLGYGEDRYCAEHQAQIERALKFRRSFVIEAA